MARYTEPENDQRYYREEPTLMEQGSYMSPENAFIKHLTERQAIDGIVEKDYLRRNNHRVFFSGKEKSTAFIGNPKTIQLNTCMRMNLSLMESLHLEELKWAEVWDNIDIMVTTHGQRGNLINALITKKQEFKDTSKQQQKSRLGQIFKKPEEPEDDRGY